MNRFQEWAQKYGSIYSLKVLDSKIIISDPQIVGRLLDKRGAIYSDRPENTVAMHVTDGHHFSFEQQGHVLETQAGHRGDAFQSPEIRLASLPCLRGRISIMLVQNKKKKRKYPMTDYTADPSTS
jgi:hypothetical protein